MVRLLGAVLCFLAIGSLPSWAQNVRDVCRTYAQDAVTFQQQNLELGCGLAGPEWNANFNYHFDWCVNGNNYRSARQWTDFRRSKIAQCREAAGQQAPPRPGKDVAAVCERYAAEAIAQQNRNRQVSCGLNGPEWNGDYRYHYDWCVDGRNSQNSRYWTKWREERLSTCVSSSTPSKSSGQAWRERLPPVVKDVMNRLNRGTDLIKSRLAKAGLRWQKYTPLDMNAVIAAARSLSQAGQYSAFERQQRSVLDSAVKTSKNLQVPPVVKSLVTAPMGNLFEPGSSVLITGTNFGAKPGKLYLRYTEDEAEFETPQVQTVELLPFRSDWAASWFGNLIIAKMPQTLPGRTWRKETRPGKLIVLAADGTQATVKIIIGNGRPVIQSMQTPAGANTIRPGQQFVLLGRNFGAPQSKGEVNLTFGAGRKKEWLQIQGTTSYVLAPIAGNDPKYDLPVQDVRLHIDDWTDNRITLTAENSPSGRYTQASYGTLIVKNKSNGLEAIVNGVTFDPGNVVRIISGSKWWDKRNSGNSRQNNAAMLVTHLPSCGATSSGEKGFDSFLRDIPFPQDVEIFRVDFRKIDPENPYGDLDFFIDQVSDIVDAVLSGPFGIAKYIAGRVLAAITSSAGGYHVYVSSFPGRNNSPGFAVDWETACVLDGKPIMYVISFSIHGRPEAVAKY